MAVNDATAVTSGIFTFFPCSSLAQGLWAVAIASGVRLSRWDSKVKCGSENFYLGKSSGGIIGMDGLAKAMAFGT